MKPGHILQRQRVQSYYEDHRPWLLSWLSKKTGSSVDAADLTQDTFVRVLQKDDTAQVAEPRAYLTRIAHGIMVNFFRRRDIEHAYLQSLAALVASRQMVAPSEETRALQLEQLVAIDRMLHGLPPRVRAAFLMHRLEGMRYADIAADMGLSVISIKKYIARAVLHCALTEGSEQP